MTSILITGGSGALGSALAERLLQEDTYERICLLSRGEYRQFQLAQQLKELDSQNRLRFFIGDVRDKDRLCSAFRGTDHIIHAAALKRIEVGNYNPMEMVKTNVMGTMNVIEAAQEVGVGKVIFINSDKSCAPVSPYGTSKAIAGSLVLAANNTSGWHGPRFAQCLYGNVWGSTGSIVPIWRVLQIGGVSSVPVTDPDCTRFYMTMAEAVALVLGTLDMMRGGETAIPTLPAYRIGDLAEAMGMRMTVNGLPPWEKKHESMSDGQSSDKARRMSIDELQEALHGM